FRQLIAEKRTSASSDAPNTARPPKSRGTPGGGLEVHAPGRGTPARAQHPGFRTKNRRWPRRSCWQAIPTAPLRSSTTPCRLATAPGIARSKQSSNRARGEMLLKCEAANLDSADGELHSAVAIASEQGARSFGLRAALLGRKRPRHLHRRIKRSVDSPGGCGFSIMARTPA